MMKIPVIDDQIGNYSTVANALSLALAGAIRKVDKQLISNVAAATDTTLKNKRLEEFVKFLSDTNKLRTILPKGKTFDDTSTESAVLLIMWTNAILANDTMAAGWESKYVEDAIKYFPLKAIK